MSYRDFTLASVVEKFSLTTSERRGLFAHCPPVEPSAVLDEMLEVGLTLGRGSGNEKARSEFIVAPILTELRRRFRAEISVFSGVDLVADPAAGLTGTCDFLLSRAPEQYFVKAPIVALVEAKRDDIAAGIGQCAAEMVGARVFNERAGNPIETIYGAVTSGTMWGFMSLAGATLAIDTDEYAITNLSKVLGILSSMIAPPARA